MDTSDEMDMFALSSNEETSVGYDMEKADTSVSTSKSKSKSESENRNPVKEQLLKQLNQVEERVERKKRQINDTKLLKEKILHKFSSRNIYGESSSSSSESELCTTSGELIVKKRRWRSKRPRKQPLVVEGSWQHVTDDKWIVGVVLQNTIEEDLEELDIHVRIKEVDKLNGISSFWTKDAKSFWRRTDLAKPGSSVAATVVIDLPKFTTNSKAEMMGVVTYKLDSECQLQTLIPTIVLTIENIMAGKHDLNLSWESSSEDSFSALDAKVQAILSVKSLAVEKISEFKSTQSFTKDIKSILEEIGLREIFPKIFAAKNGPLDRCVIELGSASTTKYRSVIYSRSIPQLNMLLQLLHNAFPKGTSVTCRNVTAEGVIKAFQTELDSYLTTRNTFELQKAVINTDLITAPDHRQFIVRLEFHLASRATHRRYGFRLIAGNRSSRLSRSRFDLLILSAASLSGYVSIVVFRTPVPTAEIESHE